VLFWWHWCGQGMKLPTGYHLLLRLTMNEAVPVLPVYAFMASRGTDFVCQ
jgi:hypothetical protein